MDLRDSIRAIKEFGKAVQRLGQKMAEESKTTKFNFEFPSTYLVDYLARHYSDEVVKVEEKVRAIFVGGPKDGKGIELDRKHIRSLMEVPYSPSESVEYVWDNVNNHYPECCDSPYQKVISYRAYFLGHESNPELIIYCSEKEFKGVSDVIKHLALNYVGPL